jgi:hypothetical protein
MGAFYKALASPKAFYYYDPLSSKGVVRSDESTLNKILLHKLLVGERDYVSTEAYGPSTSLPITENTYISGPETFIQYLGS